MESKSLNATSHGLGLNICQMIAMGLGGKITVESEKGYGSTFTCRFIAEKIVEEKESEDLE